MEGSSPRMRGALYRRGCARRSVGIIPAHAGSTLRPHRENSAKRDHPRACGEHFYQSRKNRSSSGSSPRMRGAPTCDYIARMWDRIIPAHAGSTESKVYGCTVDEGSSPRMRGARVGVERVGFADGIIPAHAGSTTLDRCIPHPGVGSSPRMRGAPTATPACTYLCRDHPRACGEHFAVKPH